MLAYFKKQALKSSLLLISVRIKKHLCWYVKIVFVDCRCQEMHLLKYMPPGVRCSSRIHSSGKCFSSHHGCHAFDKYVDFHLGEINFLDNKHSLFVSVWNLPY